MDSIFSHAGSPVSEGGARPVKDVQVACVVPRETFEAQTGFLEYIHLWWPQELTAFGAGTYLELEDGVLVETAADGRELDWASVTEQGRSSVRFEWQYGQAAGLPAVVEVRFDEVPPAADPEGWGPRTRVEVRHTGIRVAEEGADVADFTAFWSQAISNYARFMGAE